MAEVETAADVVAEVAVSIAALVKTEGRAKSALLAVMAAATVLLGVILLAVMAATAPLELMLLEAQAVAKAVPRATKATAAKVVRPAAMTVIGATAAEAAHAVAWVRLVGHDVDLKPES